MSISFKYDKYGRCGALYTIIYTYYSNDGTQTPAKSPSLNRKKNDPNARSKRCSNIKMVHSIIYFHSVWQSKINPVSVEIMAWGREGVRGCERILLFIPVQTKPIEFADFQIKHLTYRFNEVLFRYNLFRL